MKRTTMTDTETLTENTSPTKVNVKPISQTILDARSYMDPGDIDVVISHHPCSDGFAAAFCAWKCFGDKIKFVKGEYGKPIDLENLKEKNVLLLDFSFTKSIFLEARSKAKKIMILDHHQSALKEFTDNGQILEGCFFDLTRSGAVLSWEYFFGNKEIPLFIQYVQDRDLWAWKLKPESEDFTAYFYILDFEFHIYDEYLDPKNVELAIEKGKPINEYLRISIKNNAKHASNKKFEGRIVGIINARENISDLGNEICHDETVDFAAVYYWDDSIKAWKVSLRGKGLDKLDLGTIAKRYGGGGHPNAAAFVYKGNIHELFGEI